MLTRQWHSFPTMPTLNTSFPQASPVTAWQFPGEEIVRTAQRLLGPIFPLDRLAGLYDDIRTGCSGASFVDRALAGLNVSYQVVHGSQDSIPGEGPLLVVANHPFGGVEGLVMMSLLTHARPDVRVMATRMLGGIPELRAQMFFVDPFGGSDAAGVNVAPLRQSLRWLKRGGVLGIFPAGEVAHFDLKERGVREAEWRPAFAGLIRHSKASVLPLFFEGMNGPLFQLAGLIHPRLRTAMLPRELVNKDRHPIRVRIGKPIPFDRLDSFDHDEELARYLRMRVHLLGRAGVSAPARRRPAFRLTRECPVVASEKPARLAQEIAWLPAEQELVSSGDYRVYIAPARQIPLVLREIARLRETTFRRVGEGTGRMMDLDVFDRFYQHLFVWNRKTSEVVGAYRLGLTDTILAEYGLDGLYTSTLFRYGWDLIGSLTPAIEIGRSFVRPEYQKKHLPLLLLWKGIGRFVADHPKYRNLFGTVSMSNTYSEVARHLVAGYFEQERERFPMGRAVTPRTPLRVKRSLLWDRPAARCRIPDLEALSDIVSEIEPDGKGVPVLMRQYHKLGGRVLACNVDPRFNMALDALLVVDLARTEPRLLELYMGGRTRQYLDFHQGRERQRCA